MATVVTVSLAGCSGESTDSPASATQAVYEIEDEALRTRFTDGLRVGGRDIPVTRGAAPGYVPDKTCERCHPKIFESYRTVGMARAFWKAGPDSLVEDFSDAHYYHEPSNRHYEMTYADGTYEITRYQVDGDGTRYNELSRPIDSIIGSGHKGRTYFYRTPNDELYQAPLAWYPVEGVWKMPPGYERADHSGFLRQTTRDCMFCHNGYPEVPVGSDRLGQPHRFPREMPQGLGCQRCHGPGAGHVAVANEPSSTLEAIAASVFNAGRLEPERRADVCMQCHLQPDSSMMSIVRRLGRADYSYRPQQPLSDYIAHVEHDGTDDLFQINHHPYRFFKSTCFEKSGGALTCLTCHDPHVKLAPAERAAHYRNACLTCHQLEQCDVSDMQSASDSVDPLDCVSCHMPQRRTLDVIEVVMTDHLIRRTPPAGDLTARQPRMRSRKHGTPSLHPSAELDERDADVLCAVSGAARGDVAAIDRLSEAIAVGDAEDVDALVHLASGQWNAGAFGIAVKNFRRVIELQPELALAHRTIGRALLRAGDPSNALTTLERARELDPDDPETLFGLGLARHQLGQRALAMEAFQGAVRLRPLHADAYLNIGHLLANQGRYGPAAEAYGWVNRIDPARADAYTYRGAMQLLDAKLDAAVASWRRGRRAAPDDPPLAGAWAAGRVLAGAYDEGIEAAATARDAGADPAICELVLALTHHGLGSQVDAAAAHARAQARPPTPGIEATLRAVLEREASRRLGSEGR